MKNVSKTVSHTFLKNYMKLSNMCIIDSEHVVHEFDFVIVSILKLRILVQSQISEE